MSGPPPPAAVLSRAAGAAPGVAVAGTSRAGSRRLRLSLYLSFGLLALLALAQAILALKLERERAGESVLHQRLSQQTTSVLEMGRQAALSLYNPAASSRGLAVALGNSKADALAVENALSGIPPSQDTSRAALGDRLERWQAARERLWYRADLLLQQLEADDGTDLERLAAAAAALQAEVSPALSSALALAEQVNLSAERHRVEQSNVLQWGAVLALLALAVLSLVVVEPTARAVDQQLNRLASQGAELERLALVAERTQNMVLLTDLDDRVLWANEAFTRISGYPLDEALGRNPGWLMHHPGAATAPGARLRAAVQQREGVRVELLCATRDGRDLWLDVDLQPLLGADGALRGFVSVSVDITAQVADRTRMTTLLAALPAGVLVQSASGEILDVNRGAAVLLGRPREQLLDGGVTQRRLRLQREDGSPYPRDELPSTRTLKTGAGVRGETLGVLWPDGSQRWLLVNTEPLADTGGVLTCFVDVTEPRRLHDQLRTVARSDPLTGMPNRVVVIERVQRAIDHARRHAGYGFAVLFMDFDRFKQVNDSLGHSAGDELLRQIAGRLDTALRPGDAVGRVSSRLPMAARIGGDEFVVVLEGTRSMDDVATVVQRLLDLLAQPYRLGAHAVQSGVSIGIVTAEHAADTADGVLRDADTAMYEAKRAGRGRSVFFDASMHQRVVQRLAIETDLRRALREDELYVVYQPVVDLADGALTGVEALVRWRHPERGNVPPADFIPVAEESGLIDAIGAFVLRAACLQMAGWRESLGARAPQSLAVNLSRAQLKLTGLVAEVRATLEEAKLPAAVLQLEVTETLAAQDESVQATLRALKALGVRLALDDFGIGYSSLACLHLMPVDTVKVDRSFVSHAETVEYHRVLIEATIRVARTLGMSTVAEGVETASQAALMRELQCDRGQGWLYGRPMPPDELVAWIERRGEIQTG